MARSLDSVKITRRSGRRAFGVFGGAVLLIATSCSGGQTELAAPTSTAATTSAAPATTAAATLPTMPATTVAAAVPGLSREARTALVRCDEALGPLFAELVALGGDELEEAIDLCDEAAIQLEVDGGQSGLALAVAEVNLALSFANFAIVSGAFDDDAVAQLQGDVDKFSREVAAALG